MTNTEFEAHKEILRLKRSEKQSMDDVAKEYWSEISNRYYNFDREEMDLKLLHSTHIKRRDVLNFFKVKKKLDFPFYILIPKAINE